MSLRMIVYLSQKGSSVVVLVCHESVGDHQLYVSVYQAFVL